MNHFKKGHWKEGGIQKQRKGHQSSLLEANSQEFRKSSTTSFSASNSDRRHRIVDCVSVIVNAVATASIWAQLPGCACVDTWPTRNDELLDGWVLSWDFTWCPMRGASRGVRARDRVSDLKKNNDRLSWHAPSQWRESICLTQKHRIVRWNVGAHTCILYRVAGGRKVFAERTMITTSSREQSILLASDWIGQHLAPPKSSRVQAMPNRYPWPRVVHKHDMSRLWRLQKNDICNRTYITPAKCFPLRFFFFWKKCKTQFP